MDPSLSCNATLSEETAPRERDVARMKKDQARVVRKIDNAILRTDRHFSVDSVFYLTQPYHWMMLCDLTINQINKSLKYVSVPLLISV